MAKETTAQNNLGNHKLMIAGSRDIKEFDLKEYIPPETDLIITGGAKGIDTLAEKYADKHRISKLILHPDYARYKRNAPLKRNETMVDISDEVLAVWDGKSKGTKHTIEYAKKTGKKVTVLTPRCAV